MKKRQLQQLRERSVADLEHELKNRETSLEKLQEDLESGKVKNVKGIRAIKKDIAQILTLIREKKSV